MMTFSHAYLGGWVADFLDTDSIRFLGYYPYRYLLFTLDDTAVPSKAILNLANEIRDVSPASYIHHTSRPNPASVRGWWFSATNS
jgi:hypothetical protein